MGLKRRPRRKPSPLHDRAPATALRRQLGRAIRRRRHAASLTLATVSERAGVSVSMLSQVERGLIDPSLDTLRNIADALGTAPVRLLAEEDAVTGLVRRGDGRVGELDGGRLRVELVSPPGSAVEIAVCELEAGHSRPSGPRRTRRGDQPGAAGRRRARDRRRARGGLAAGDCVTFDAGRPHRVTAVGDGRRLPRRDPPCGPVAPLCLACVPRPRWMIGSLAPFQPG